MEHGEQEEGETHKYKIQMQKDSHMYFTNIDWPQCYYHAEHLILDTWHPYTLGTAQVIINLVLTIGDVIRTILSFSHGIVNFIPYSMFDQFWIWP